jgi:hypothetical protein
MTDSLFVSLFTLEWCFRSNYYRFLLCLFSILSLEDIWLELWLDLERVILTLNIGWYWNIYLFLFHIYLFLDIMQRQSLFPMLSLIRSFSYNLILIELILILELFLNYFYIIINCSWLLILNGIYLPRLVLLIIILILKLPKYLIIQGESHWSLYQLMVGI